MNVQFKVTNKGEIAILPRKDYEALAAKAQEADEDVGTARLGARARKEIAAGMPLIPKEVVDRIVSGENALTKLKSVPKFRNEVEDRRFWETHDASNYVDWSKSERVRLPNLKPSTTSISLRLPVTLLERIKVAANKRDVPYQSLIKTWLAEKIGTR